MNKKLWRLWLIFHLVFLVLIIFKSTLGYAKYLPEKVNFSIKFKEEISPYRIIAIFVLPNENVNFEILDDNNNQAYLVTNERGIIKPVANRIISWQAPTLRGLYKVKIQNIQKTEIMKLNIFVMVPFNELTGEYLNGYRIGKYPDIPLRQLWIYKKPKGFIEVTNLNQEILVSPHFKLKQFLSKQSSKFPKYLVLRERLLLKLELILEKVTEKGYSCETLHIMSGYRTPYYNKAIGNVKYSRHVYGGAADVFIDENPKDGMMDDLNKDSKIDYRDAAVIYEILDKMYGKKWYEIFVGGLGRYKKTASHGPFIHVDVRGFRARWGL